MLTRCSPTSHDDVWLSLYEGFGFLGVFRNHRLIRLKDQTDRPVEVGYAGTWSLLCDKNGNVWLPGYGGIGEVHNDRDNIFGPRA
jgi:hypothetical protein